MRKVLVVGSVGVGISVSQLSTILNAEDVVIIDNIEEYINQEQKPLSFKITDILHNQIDDVKITSTEHPFKKFMGVRKKMY